MSAEGRTSGSAQVETGLRRESGARVGIEVRDRPSVVHSRTRVRSHSSEPDVQVVHRRRGVRHVTVEEDSVPAVKKTVIKRKVAAKHVSKKKKGTKYVVKSRRYVAEPATTVRRRTVVRSYSEPDSVTVRSRRVRSYDRDTVRVGVGARERTGVSIGVRTGTQNEVRGRDGGSRELTGGARTGGSRMDATGSVSGRSGGEQGGARSEGSGSAGTRATGSAGGVTGGGPSAGSGAAAPATR
ncbi:hypothetical protein [Enterovirga aerilata]|uniref:Uncharacterized protein n=1 Tax=Enterovirga aerilata TaxID=2730920 RepID=A0A849IA91_9HYPH|nr:hypothetical protein [Enterovirga sp. DB1703]NNM73319.1 hypothetical protein [Enterovirga sp. DB1703]